MADKVDSKKNSGLKDGSEIEFTETDQLRASIMRSLEKKQTTSQATTGKVQSEKVTKQKTSAPREQDRFSRRIQARLQQEGQSNQEAAPKKTTYRSSQQLSTPNNHTKAPQSKTDNVDQSTITTKGTEKQVKNTVTRPSLSAGGKKNSTTTRAKKSTPQTTQQPTNTKHVTNQNQQSNATPEDSQQNTSAQHKVATTKNVAQSAEKQHHTTNAANSSDEAQLRGSKATPVKKKNGDSQATKRKGQSTKARLSINDYLEEVEALPMKEQRRAIRKKENSIVQKIVLTLSLVFVVILIIVGITFWNFWQNGQKPLDTSDTKTELVEIPLGSSNKQIANILEKEKIIKSALVFNYYMKLNNQSGFQAGFYQLSPSMTLDQIAKKMKDGDMEVQTVAIPEGYSAEQIAEAVEKSTPYTAKEFLAVLSDEAYFKKLLADFPELLTSASEASDERYKLEGYLFPATYTLTPGSDVEGLVTQMVNKSNDVLSQYYSVMTEKGLTVHQVLTLASLVEKEGVHDEDRRNIAQVFFNRLAADMPLQSDISVLYALNEHKTLLTIEDTKVDSPYNLYINKGYGPGPFDSPSEDAIKAVLYPNANSYYYFVADVDTGAVYFAETLEEHNALVDKYVNK